jgi:hypothetical protein
MQISNVTEITSVLKNEVNKSLFCKAKNLIKIHDDICNHRAVGSSPFTGSKYLQQLQYLLITKGRHFSLPFAFGIQWRVKFSWCFAFTKRH